MTIIAITNSANTQLFPNATVEAEYGQVVVEGSQATLAHHADKWAGRPCPCLGGSLGLNLGDRDLIQVSHFDLDTLGGVARAMGWKAQEEENLFWKAAALVDTMGPHHLQGRIRDLLWREATEGLSMATPAFDDANYHFEEDWLVVVEQLQAFWAWSQNHRLFAPRDGNALDVSSFFKEAWRVVSLLLVGEDACPETQRLLEGGRSWARANEALNEASFLEAYGKEVALRQSTRFVNHLYRGLDGELFKAVVNFNPKVGSVTLSLADPVEGVSCVDIARNLWGPEAGGHPGIAGSPRKGGLALANAVEAAAILAGKLGNPCYRCDSPYSEMCRECLVMRE